MFHRPRTKEEAEKHRYSKWAGNPKGFAYVPALCAAEVWPAYRGGMVAVQCSRRSGKGPDGLYCAQHAKIVEQENG